MKIAKKDSESGVVLLGAMVGLGVSVMMIATISRMGTDRLVSANLTRSYGEKRRAALVAKQLAGCDSMNAIASTCRNGNRVDLLTSSGSSISGNRSFPLGGYDVSAKCTKTKKLYLIQVKLPDKRVWQGLAHLDCREDGG